MRWKVSENEAAARKLVSFLYECMSKEVGVDSPFGRATMGAGIHKKYSSRVSLSIDCFKKVLNKYPAKVGRWRLKEGVYEMASPRSSIAIGPFVLEFSTPMDYFTEKTKGKLIKYLKSFDEKGFVFNPLNGLEKAADNVLKSMKSLQDVCQGKLLSTIIIEDSPEIATFAKGLVCQEIPTKTRKLLRLSKSFEYRIKDFCYEGHVDFEGGKVTFRDLSLRLFYFASAAKSFSDHFPFNIDGLKTSSFQKNVIENLDFSRESRGYNLREQLLGLCKGVASAQWITQKGGCSFDVPLKSSNDIQGLLGMEKAGKWLVEYSLTNRTPSCSHKISYNATQVSV